MTDNDIIKALKEILSILCCNGDLQMASTVSDGINLINRQKAEIDYWKRNAFDGCMERDRIDKKAKAEAIKEFADRLKADIVEDHENPLNCSFPVVTAQYVDKLVKEMVGDNNG